MQALQLILFGERQLDLANFSRIPVKDLRLIDGSDVLLIASGPILFRHQICGVLHGADKFPALFIRLAEPQVCNAEVRVASALLLHGFTFGAVHHPKPFCEYPLFYGDGLRPERLCLGIAPARLAQE